jgi:hypothetical protein
VGNRTEHYREGPTLPINELMEKVPRQLPKILHFQFPPPPPPAIWADIIRDYCVMTIRLPQDAVFVRI